MICTPYSVSLDTVNQMILGFCLARNPLWALDAPGPRPDGWAEDHVQIPAFDLNQLTQ